NAVKFTAQGSILVHITLVEADTHAVTLRFSVMETGLGMEERQYEELFDAYPLRVGHRHHPDGGAGLGLLISKRLVEQMGGDIGAKSASGEGSEFWFRIRLPIASVAALPDGLEPVLASKRAHIYAPHAFTRLALRETLSGWDMQVTEAASVQELSAETGAHVWIVDLSRAPNPLALMEELCVQDAPPCLVLLSLSVVESLGERAGDGPARLAKPVRPAALRMELARMLGAQLDTRETPPPASSTEAGDGYAPRVLVVEDDSVSRRFITSTLEAQGAQTMPVANIKEAAALLDREAFDAIILDLRLPDGSGADLAARLRQQPGYATTTILALTADATEDVRQTALRAGVDEVLFKPVDPDILWGEILARAGKQTDKARGRDQQAVGRKADLISLLRDDIPLRRRELEAAVQECDFARIANIAHTLAGGAAFCQARELQEAATALQDAARDEDASTLEKSLARVHHAMEDLLSASD
ncbi:MAG: hypothetical protein DRQ37_08295, partial [Gammaproteobacteria bacterium]